MVITIIYSLFNVNKRKRKAAETNYWSDFELHYLTSPDPVAEIVLSKSNDDKPVVEKIIEIETHPTINTALEPYNIGWEPAEISISKSQVKIEYKNLFEKYRITEDEKKNDDGRKFALTDWESVLLENPTTSLKFHETSFHVVNKFKDELIRNRTLLGECASIEPNKNLIPNSFCLHYILEFNDGNILIYKRSDNAAYYKNHFSFSGEEQISDTDFQRNEGLMTLFKRAILEEIFPLGTKGHESMELGEIDTRWDQIKTFVNSTKIWSLIYEADIANFSVMGFIKLNLSISEYKKEYKRLKQLLLGSRYNEGALFYASKNQLEDLIFSHTSKAKSVFLDEEITIDKDFLHPSSRYRILRYLKAKLGRDISLIDYKKEKYKKS